MSNIEYLDYRIEKVLITEEQIKKDTSCQLLGIAKPEDVADIILFLLSDASRMITGREIYADGGYIHFFAG